MSILNRDIYFLIGVSKVLSTKKPKILTLGRLSNRLSSRFKNNLVKRGYISQKASNAQYIDSIFPNVISF